jgi:phosphoglycolate phosphatase-like HAD superfamily hydrolase
MMSKENAALFFDFDGVILDSVAIKTTPFVELFKPYGDQVLSQLLDYHRQHGGISRIEKIKFAHEHLIGKPLSEHELIAWGQRYSQLLADKVVGAAWIPGAREFLEEVNGDIPVFVISGTPETELLQLIEKRNMTAYFTEMRGSPTRKPAHIRDLISRYRLNPDHCVFVGDALTDYNAARETGLLFVGIQGDIEFPEGTVVLPDCTRLKETILQL